MTYCWDISRFPVDFGRGRRIVQIVHWIQHTNSLNRFIVNFSWCASVSF